MLGHTVVGIVDNVMVGKLGPTELAAVSLGNSFIFYCNVIRIGFSTAITPMAKATVKEILKKGEVLFTTVCTYVLF
jgi:MATE family multidrug resistance protein